jgi:hypothetical protein
MEQRHHTFIVKITKHGDQPPRGYIIDNASQGVMYFENLVGLDEFILSHLYNRPIINGQPESDCTFSTTQTEPNPRIV